MRLTVPFAAGTVGLAVLGMAVFGQPAVYMRQARSFWYEVFNAPPADEPAIDPEVREEAKLRLEVVRLEDQLQAARKARSDDPAPAEAGSADAVVQAPAKPAAPVKPAAKPVEKAAEARHQAVAAVPPPKPAEPPKIVMAEPVPAVVPEPSPSRPVEPPAAKIVTPPQAKVAEAPPPQPIEMPQAKPPEAPPAKVAAVAPPPPAGSPPTKLVEAPPTKPAEKPVPKIVEAPPPKPAGVLPRVVEAPSPKPVEPSPSGSDATPTIVEAAPKPLEVPSPKVVDAPQPKPVAPPAPKVAEAAPPKPAKPVKVATAAPAPPILTPAEPARRLPDDADLVIARLRQSTRGAPPLQEAGDFPPPEARPQQIQPPPPLPAMPQLNAARNALAAGRIEDARRQLQLAQLHLVFRTQAEIGTLPPTATRASSDVAGALEALSANDPALSRRYIDVALGDLSGTEMPPPQRVFSSALPSGYAPAYPPR